MTTIIVVFTELLTITIVIQLVTIKKRMLTFPFYALCKSK